MKTTTLLALVAAATLGYATPVPEQQAEAAEQGQQSEAGTAWKGTYPPSPQGVDPSWGGSGGHPPTQGWYPPAPQSYDPAPVPPPPHPYGGAPPPPLPYGGGPPYDPGYGYPYNPAHAPPSSGSPGGSGGFGGGVIVGGSGGGAGGVIAGGGFGFGGGSAPSPPPCDDPWCAGLPPGSWHISDFPKDSPFNNGGLQQIAGDCSAQQQAVSCCNGDSDSSGLVGGVLPSGACSFDLLSDHCNQHVACCDTTGGGLLTIGGLCQLVSL